MIGLRAAAGSPDAKDGIAQYPVGGQLARRGSVSFGMVRRRDDHFGKGLTVSRGPEIGDRLPDHPAAPSVSPDKSHGPVIDIDDPRLAQKVMIPTARSEEHTSELQSLMRISSAVFCLHKKKKQKTTQ